MNTLVLSVDGLHSGMIGAYGNGWIQTPTLDALACRSALADRFYAQTLDLPSIFEILWRPGVIPRDIGTILLTDDSDVMHHRIASDFRRRHLLDLPCGDAPVETLEETQFFKAIAATVDLIRQGESPCFCWTHLRGFRGPWDFPPDYRKRHQDEEDPEPYAGVRPPELLCRNEGEQIHPDDLQAVMEAYAGGMAVLDEALEGLIDLLDDGRLGGDTLFVLLGVRGFSLGEHGRIGENAETYGENVQVPLVLRFPDRTGETVRIPSLLRFSDLADFLADRPDRSPLMQLVREEIDEICERVSIEGTGGESALATREWFLRKTDGNGPRIELYVKPDDRWEVNDVADRCPEVLENLVPGAES